MFNVTWSNLAYLIICYWQHVYSKQLIGESLSEPHINALVQHNMGICIVCRLVTLFLRPCDPMYVFRVVG